MEIWELLKSLFSEVNFSFWNASVVHTPQYSLADIDQVQNRSLRALTGRGAALPEQLCESSSASGTDSQRNGSQTGWGRRVCHRVTVQKSHILGKCILSDQCAMLFKRLRNTAACCYETYRVRREGRVESPSHFGYCCDISTDRQRMQRGRLRILQLCWCYLTGMSITEATEATLWSEEPHELNLLALCEYTIISF